MSGANRKIVNVAIIGPTDADEAKIAIEASIRSWNNANAEALGLHLNPRRWPVDITATSDADRDGQELTNKQIIQTADVVFAVFYSRLGARTPRAPSGSAEEIELALETGKPCHIYFHASPEVSTSSLATGELERLDAYREMLRHRGVLTGEWPVPEGFGGLVDRAIRSDMQLIHTVDEVISAEGKRQSARRSRTANAWGATNHSRFNGRSHPVFIAGVLTVALVVAGLFGIRALQTRQQSQAAKDRFTAAVADLDSDSAITRGAAITELFAVADVWSELGAGYIADRDKCISAIQTYLRRPVSEGSGVSTDPEELGIRRGISQSLHAHLMPGALHAWNDYAFDFSDTYFVDADFTSVVLEAASFSGATFIERASFTEARLGSSTVNSQNWSVADFSDSMFSDGASFLGTAFEAGATFSSAFFDGAVDFRQSAFLCPEYGVGCNVYFSAAVFAGSAAFGGAEFDQPTYFTDTRFATEPLFFQTRNTTGPAVFQGEREGRPAVDVTGATAITYWGAVCPLAVEDGIPQVTCTPDDDDPPTPESCTAVGMAYAGPSADGTISARCINR